MGLIDLGDYVKGTDNNAAPEKARIVAIFGVDAVLAFDGNGGWDFEQHQVDVWTANPAVRCVKDLADYIGKKWIYYPLRLLEKIGGVKKEIKVKNVCTKCGQFDEYASPDPKNNNEVRCYKHCG